MVRALLDGRKTQTRRKLRVLNPNMLIAAEHDGGRCLLQLARFAKGDRLWVRETFARVGFKEPEPVNYRADGEHQHMGTGRESNGDETAYYTDCWERNGGRREGSAWKPGIHMPRWASRLTLTVTDVRVQRLQEINEEDAKAEGATAAVAGHGDDGPIKTYRTGFVRIWQEINGNWLANPWIVALTFTVEKANIDEAKGDAAEEARSSNERHEVTSPSPKDHP
jgi:hypothetical protein